MIMRTCKKCGAVKDIERFGLDTHLKTGRKGSCLTCTNKYNTILYGRTRSKHRKYGSDSKARGRNRYDGR